MAVNKNKIQKIKIQIHDFMTYVMHQGVTQLMARFQTNYIFKIYIGDIQNKNINMDEKHRNQSLAKK